jgi:DNA-binding XRE family transcriptional regulator
MLKNNLSKIRKSRNLMRSDISDKLGYTDDSSISKLERGIREPKITTALKISKILKVKVEEIWSL